GRVCLARALRPLGGGGLHHADPVLSVSPGLLDMPALGAAVAGNGLAIRDARRGRRRLYAVLPRQLLEDHVQVDVAKPRDDQLVRLLDPLDVQGGILLRQARKAARDLLLVAASLGGDGEAVSGSR